MMRILLTGAGGFLGRAVYEGLRTKRDRSYEIVCIARTPTVPADPSWISADLTAAEPLQQLKGPFDAILHLAAVLPSHNQIRPGNIDDNVLMAQNLASVSRSLGVKKFINISSISVYPMGAAPVLNETLTPHPKEPYGKSKLLAELYLHDNLDHSVALVNLRLSSLYGPWQSRFQRPGVLFTFLKNALCHKNIVLHGRGERTQDFIHIKDAVQGILMALDGEFHGTYNLASGTAVKMSELAEAVRSAVPKWQGKILYDPQADEGASVAVDITKFRKETGFSPEVDLLSGLKEILFSETARSSSE